MLVPTWMLITETEDGHKITLNSTDGESSTLAVDKSHRLCQISYPGLEDDDEDDDDWDEDDDWDDEDDEWDCEDEEWVEDGEESW